MKKYLLIDDMALKGWKSVIEKAIIKEPESLEVATTYEEALNKIETKYDLIFLDVRLTEHDHSVIEISDYTGFKILKEIKKSYLKINFSTPIILITASNKIWNIDAFRDYGVDTYYIKEHPDHIISKESSISSLKNLQKNFLNLIVASEKRNEIWKLCAEIIELIEKHQYFNNQDSRFLNIKNRIIDKLKLGYSHLFKSQTKIEKELLLSNNESLSFIILFSILEEISKGFTDISETWDKRYNRNGNWKFRNKEYFIEYDQKKDTFKINNNIINENDFRNYYNGILYLSQQIHALLYAYSKGEKKKELDETFKKINEYRNETDFIHSSVENILTKDLISKEIIDQAFDMNVKILKFIKEIFLLKI